MAWLTPEDGVGVGVDGTGETGGEQSPPAQVQPAGQEETHLEPLAD
jgi:hypothetical protein